MTVTTVDAMVSSLTFNTGGGCILQGHYTLEVRFQSCAIPKSKKIHDNTFPIVGVKIHLETNLTGLTSGHL